MQNNDLKHHRQKLKCNFPQIEKNFETTTKNALKHLTEKGLDKYFEGASLICMIGRGCDPVMVYLEEMPALANQLGEPILEIVSQAVWKISRTPNGNSIPPFIKSIPDTAKRLGSIEQLENFLSIMFDFMEKSTGSIHGIHSTEPSPGLPELLKNLPLLLRQLSLDGLKKWIEYGARNYKDHPERQKHYFSLQSADSKAMLQRERHGTLFMDHQRQLDLYLRALWNDESYFVPYSTAFDQLEGNQQLSNLVPYYDEMGIRLPDVMDDFTVEVDGFKKRVSGLDRYRLTIAHIAAHRKWSTKIVADNFSPFQRLAVEHLEDCRVEYLMLKEYPGLKQSILLLHPKPTENACNTETESCIRHRLAVLSRAILDDKHGYSNEHILNFVKLFHLAVYDNNSSTKAMADLAVLFTARTRLHSDQSAKIRFENTEVSYRDDNRHLWIYIEENDEAEDFKEHRPKKSEALEDDNGLPPRY